MNSSCNCRKYSKTIEEIFEAGSKHKKAALAVKEVADQQKVKIREFRDLTTKLQDTIENLELDLQTSDKRVKNLESAKKGMERKMVQLQEDVDSGYSIVQNRGKELQRLNLNISELKKEVKEKDENISSLEKRKNISDTIIKTLQSEKADLASIADVEIKLKHGNDIKVLMEEIGEIEIENKQKEEEIRELNKMNTDIKETLENVERTNEGLREQLEKKEISQEECKSIGSELGISNPCSLNVSIESEICYDEILNAPASKNHINHQHREADVQKILHFKMKEIELKKKITDMKFKLLTSAYELREKESVKRHVCTCRSFCRIFHKKHNYAKSGGKDVLEKLKTLNACEPCDETFIGLR